MAEFCNNSFDHFKKVKLTDDIEQKFSWKRSQSSVVKLCLKLFSLIFDNTTGPDIESPATSFLYGQ